MKKYFKYILCFGLFILNTSEVIALSDTTQNGCNKRDLGTSDTYDGVVCTKVGSVCNADCASGWTDEPCAADEDTTPQSSFKCYINDSNCNNNAWCHKCVKKTVPCNSCQSGYIDSTACTGTCSGTYSINSGTSCNTQSCCLCTITNCSCDTNSSLAQSTCNTTTYTQAANGNCPAMTCTGQKTCTTPSGGSCQFVSDPCYVMIGGSCMPQYGTVTFIGGAIKPYNCTCEESYNKNWACYPDHPWACTSGSGVQTCYDGSSSPCDYCGGVICEKSVDPNDKSGWTQCVPDNGICGKGKAYNYCTGCSSCWFDSGPPDYANVPGYYSHIYNYNCTVPCGCEEINSDPDNFGQCNITTENTNFSSTLGPQPGADGYSDLCWNIWGTWDANDNLTSSNLSPAVLQGNTWTWTCPGKDWSNQNPSCPTNIGCSAPLNSPPKFEGIDMYGTNFHGGVNGNTVISSLVPAETTDVGTSRNQICDDRFYGNRIVSFIVSASDPNNDKISAVLKWNNQPIGLLYSDDKTYFQFNWSGTAWNDPIPDSLNDNVVHPLMVTITDEYGNTTGEINTGRYFKIWDCNVPISGTIYDSTDNGGNADYSTGIGFSNPADPAVLKFSSLDFIGGGGISVGMAVNSPNYNSVTNHHLTWGVNTYVPNFNGDISLTSPKIRYKNSKSGSSWNGNTNAYVDTIGIVDPYDVASIGITADFSGILIQDPWWQANGGGVISNTSITGQVPATCTETNSCISQIGISGLVSAPSISNVGNPSYQNWYYGSTSGLPNNNAKLADSNTNYSYFYSQYFVKKGVGTTFSGNKSISDIVDTGIYFIEGNLNIDTDKTLTNPSDFLMIIVSGDINVGIGASRVDGILVANNIGASGASDNQLIFNGSLYAADSVNFSRDYYTNNRINNNSTPVVVVNYDPKLIFNMPGDIAKVLTNWQWGN
ncbi:MAG: hypothetical protein PHS06_01730 [Candidatus Shapirobacteria bacterium]|nr:hypothetical protein [Candidatus Shapirobacteria bacterium]